MATTKNTLDPALLLRLDTMRTTRDRIVGAMVALIGFGLVMIYSASAIRMGLHGWEMQTLVTQCRWLAIGSVGMVVFSLIDYRVWEKCWLPILVICFILLAAVRVPGIGTKVNGAYRWLRYGGYNMQPSELAKLGLIIAFAALLARKGKDGRLPFIEGFLPAAGLVGLVCGLIAVEPDFGTAALIGAVLLSLLIVGGAGFWQVTLLIMLAVPPALFYGVTRLQHLTRRVMEWLSGEGYQVGMSVTALGSGGVTGMGLGKGTAKLFYLPEAHTDFIFAIAGQELGLIGTLTVLLIFAIFVREGMRLVALAHDRFGALLAFGITMLIGLQVAFNLAVVTGAIPPKGISLPFVSFGGSGLCVSMAAVGLLSSIARSRPEEIPAASTEGFSYPESVYGKPVECVS